MAQAGPARNQNGEARVQAARYVHIAPDVALQCSAIHADPLAAADLTRWLAVLIGGGPARRSQTMA